MKLYQTREGIMIGFYQGMGGEVECLGYRDIYEQQLVTKFRVEELVIPGHYEMKPFWFEEHYITKYYWREAHPARGLEAAWIPYMELVPAGFSITRVWVDEKIEYETVSYQELEPVLVGQEPIYSYVDPEASREYELEIVPEDWAEQLGEDDAVNIVNIETGEVVSLTARYMGLAQQIDENEYVVP